MKKKLLTSRFYTAFRFSKWHYLHIFEIFKSYMLRHALCIKCSAITWTYFFWPKPDVRIRPRGEAGLCALRMQRSNTGASLRSPECAAVACRSEDAGRILWRRMRWKIGVLKEKTELLPQSKAPGRTRRWPSLLCQWWPCFWTVSCPGVCVF